MAALKSICNNCSSAIYCTCKNGGDNISDSRNNLNSILKNLNYYLFGDKNIPTSVLVNRVMSKTFIDINLVSIIENPLNVQIIDDYLLDSDSDIMNDPILSSILSDSSDDSDEDDDYDSDNYSEDFNYSSFLIDNAFEDIMDGVIYNISDASLLNNENDNNNMNI